MSYQQGPPPPGMGTQQQQPPNPAQPAPPPEPTDPRAIQEAEAERILTQILGGQLPGAGYLFPDRPQVRQANLIKTTPEDARDALLRAVELCAQGSLLPYGAVAKGEYAKAALAFSQAYLLLDPTVDEAGVPVAAKAAAGAEAQAHVAREGAHAQGEAQQEAAVTQAHGQAHVAQVTAEAAGTARFTHPTTPRGHPLPPRVGPNAAEEQIDAKSKTKQAVLKGARGDRPRPRPRVGE